ncbi:cellulose synthase subunit BcsC-related outer membrane protein, partial [Nostoc sp. NIES-2111]
GQLQARTADAPGLITNYPSQSESGVIGSLRGDLQYSISRDLALGALLRYDRSANWNEARGGVYVRYQLAD